MTVREEAMKRFREWGAERELRALLHQVLFAGRDLDFSQLNEVMTAVVKRIGNTPFGKDAHVGFFAMGGLPIPLKKTIFNPNDYATVVIDNQSSPPEKPRRTCTICGDPIYDGWCRCIVS